MRIACLQFAPQIKDVSNNINRADAILNEANPKDLDLLVLPELAFSGYNFKSLQEISPFLEYTTSGASSVWARKTALKHNCSVVVGYPEKVDVTPKWPSGPEYYNSAITCSREGKTVANYRKSFLYYTDEKWALEGPTGFYAGDISGLGRIAMGICMDINPYKFETPWNAWEFAYHILHEQANLVILSMAWLTREPAETFYARPSEPDMETLSYWIARMEPLIRSEGEDEIIVVFANRTGTEDGAVYAGTTCILGIQDGEVRVYGLLGRGEKELLVVDTSQPPQAKIVTEQSTLHTETTNDNSTSQAASVPAKTDEVSSPAHEIEPDMSQRESTYSSVASFQDSKNASQPLMTEQGQSTEGMAADEETPSANRPVDFQLNDTRMPHSASFVPDDSSGNAHLGARDGNGSLRPKSSIW